MFEIQADKGPGYAEIFSSAGTRNRKSRIELAQSAEMPSTAGNDPIRLSQLENVKGQRQTRLPVWRIADFSALARFCRLPKLREMIHCAVAVANLRYSVKMSIGILCVAPAGDRRFSSVNASRITVSESSRVLQAMLSSHYRNERGLKLCR
jgi:hypothetical protein